MRSYFSLTFQGTCELLGRRCTIDSGTNFSNTEGLEVVTWRLRGLLKTSDEEPDIIGADRSRLRL